MGGGHKQPVPLSYVTSNFVYLHYVQTFFVRKEVSLSPLSNVTPKLHLEMWRNLHSGHGFFWALQTSFPFLWSSEIFYNGTTSAKSCQIFTLDENLLIKIHFAFGMTTFSIHLVMTFWPYGSMGHAVLTSALLPVSSEEHLAQQPVTCTWPQSCSRSQRDHDLWPLRSTSQSRVAVGLGEPWWWLLDSEVPPWRRCLVRLDAWAGYILLNLLQCTQHLGNQRWKSKRQE